MNFKKSPLHVRANQLKENVKSIFSLEQIPTTYNLPSLKSTKVSKTESQYGKMLRESRKLRLFYGNLSKKYLQKVFQKSCFSPSRSRETLFSILESRLDVVLYRAGFFESIAAAKQMIHLGGIKINKKKVVSPGYIVVPGDVVRVLERKKDTPLRREVLQKKVLRSRYLSRCLLSSATQMALPKTKGNADQIIGKTVSTDLRLKEQKNVGWRFQRSFFLLSKVKQSSTVTLILLVNKALTLLKSKTQSLFQYNNEREKVSDFLSEYSLSSKPFAIKEEMYMFPDFTCTKCKGVDTHGTHGRIKDSVEGKARNIVSVGLGKEDVFLKNNKRSRVVQQLPFLAFYQRKIFDFLKIKTLFINKQKTDKVKGFQIKAAFSKEISQQKSQHQKSDWCTQLSNAFVFSNYRLNLRKQLLSLQRKKDCFFKQKKQSFFKDQKFFESKKTKPLHLEVSFRSLSIIFLFPPQRICFPTFINLSLIYK